MDAAEEGEDHGTIGQQRERSAGRRPARPRSETRARGGERQDAGEPEQGGGCRDVGQERAVEHGVRNRASGGSQSRRTLAAG